MATAEEASKVEAAPS